MRTAGQDQQGRRQGRKKGKKRTQGGDPAFFILPCMGAPAAVQQPGTEERQEEKRGKKWGTPGREPADPEGVRAARMSRKRPGKLQGDNFTPGRGKNRIRGSKAAAAVQTKGRQPEHRRTDQGGTCCPWKRLAPDLHRTCTERGHLLPLGMDQGRQAGRIREGGRQPERCRGKTRNGCRRGNRDGRKQGREGGRKEEHREGAII